MHKSLMPGLILILLSGCVRMPDLPDARFTQGDAPIKPGRVVMLTPECRGVGGVCTRSFTSTLAGRLSGELELAGYQVVMAEDLFAEARRIKRAGGNVDGAGPFGTFWVSANGGTETSLRYNDLPPEGKRALLEEARAQGVLKLSVVVGEDLESSPWYDLHEFELTSTYSIGEGEAFGWAARCYAVGESRDVLGGIGVTYNQAASQLAQCVGKQAL